MDVVRIEHVHDARCGRALPARVYPQSRLHATGNKSLVSLHFTKPGSGTLEEQKKRSREKNSVTLEERKKKRNALRAKKKKERS